MTGRCFECGAPAKNWHHVVPRKRGGTCMVPLCVPCHKAAHECGVTYGQLSRPVQAVRPKGDIEKFRLKLPMVEMERLRGTAAQAGLDLSGAVRQAAMAWVAEMKVRLGLAGRDLDVEGNP